MDVFVAVAFGATLVVEIILSGTWDGFYFRYSLPVFRWSLGELAVGRISSRWLTEHYAGSWFVPLRFHRLSGSELAVSEPLVSLKLFGFLPLVHGLVEGDLVTGHARLVLRANWWPVGLLGSLWLLVVWDAWAKTHHGPWLTSAAIVAAVFVFAFSVEFFHYRRLVRLIQEQFGGEPELWWGGGEEREETTPENSD